jgi:hypothetical protein
LVWVWASDSQPELVLQLGLESEIHPGLVLASVFRPASALESGSHPASE